MIHRPLIGAALGSHREAASVLNTAMMDELCSQTKGVLRALSITQPQGGQRGSHWLARLCIWEQLELGASSGGLQWDICVSQEPNTVCMQEEGAELLLLTEQDFMDRGPGLCLV